MVFIYLFIYKFYQLRNIVNTKTAINVYKALIESIIKYGIVIWGSAYNIVLDNLKIIQKHFIKIILKKPKQYRTKLYTKQNVHPHLYKTRSQKNKTLLAPKPTKPAFVQFIDTLK